MSNSSNTILVPIDSTEQTIIALNQSYNLARLTKSKIVLLSVEEEGQTGSSVQKRLAELAKEAAEKTGCVVETMVRKGNVYEEINKVADVINPIVMVGLTSKITLNKIIGKNAFKMVRESKHPVITIRGKVHRDGCKTILLPLDLTKETREKVDNAIKLAKQFDASIRIISILSQKDEESENKLISYSNQVWKHIKAQGIKCSVKTLRGTNVPQMILDYAHEVEADLILIMSKAELNVKEFFIGTVAQRIINESDIPVLSYRPMERKDLTSFTTPY
ncbi:MAG TPA: universal stress protein [Bacteroidia bacterium]|jgi:nucleotide-binding universal stress UspA family protein|nr:universal stress protein [Bacteroidia bacterium]